MTRRVIAFDLDNTRADSKSPIADRMAGLLDDLLRRSQVCVVSGGAFAQFEEQLLGHLKAAPGALKALHVMPRCGMRYFRFDAAANAWQRAYAEYLTDAQRTTIVAALENGADSLGYRPAKLWGPQVEDHGSQVTFPALGRETPLARKQAWDPDGSKKRKLRDRFAKAIPEFEVRVGGTPSVDMTKPSIDKAYTIKKLIKLFDVTKKDVFLRRGSVEQRRQRPSGQSDGVDCLEVSGWPDTALVIETILRVS